MTTLLDMSRGADLKIHGVRCKNYRDPGQEIPKMSIEDS